MYKITIDGFNGTGKTTLAKRLASQLDYTYVSMGMIFRCVAYEMIKNNIYATEIDKIQSIIENIQISLPNNTQKDIYINGQCVTEEIKDMRYAELCSNISNNFILQNGVRNIIRKYVATKNIIVDGRDTGRLLFPDADVKFALTATIETRAKRRAIELGRSESADISDIITSMNEIDEKLINGNCIPPEDAIKIDTTNLSIQQITNICLQEINKNINNKNLIKQANINNDMQLIVKKKLRTLSK